MDSFRRGKSDERYYFKCSLDDFGTGQPVVFQVQ